jgi:hypothetical protein
VRASNILVPLTIAVAGCGDNAVPQGAPSSNLAASFNGGGCHPIGTTSQMIDMLQLTDPEWAPVVDGQQVESAPVYVHGVARHAHGDTGGDFPFTHGRPDATAEITPDADDAFRLASGNVTGEGGQMEFEWENGAFPMWMLPGDGDRIVVFGRWIFDCGHPDSSPGHCAAAPASACVLDSDCAATDRCVGAEFGYTSEIHPPQAVAVMRQGRGGIVVDGGAPVLATRADIFVSPNGGAAGDRCMLAHHSIGDIVLDVQCYPLAQPIAKINATDFEFDVPLPPPPPNAHAAWRIVDQPQDLFGGVAAAIEVTPHENDPSPFLHVVVKMTRPTAAGMPTGFAATMFAGWDAPPSTPLTHVRVSIDSLAIVNALKPATPVIRDAPGWRMQVAVNGEWQVVTGLDNVATGDVVAQTLVFDQYLPIDGTAAVHLVANGTSASCIDTFYGTNLSDQLNTLGWGAGVACLVTTDPYPGEVDVTFNGPTFGAGAHATPSQRADGGTCSTTTATACIADNDCPTNETCVSTGTAFAVRYTITTVP